MWRAGSSSSQTGPGEASWDRGLVPGNKRVISSLPSSPLSSRSLTPRVCLPSNTIISPDGCRSAMRACQGTLQYSWWKLLMFAVMMLKRYTPDLSIDSSFIWMCQSTDASLAMMMRFLKDCSEEKKKEYNFPSYHVKHMLLRLLRGLIGMNGAASADTFHLWGAAEEPFQALRYQTNLLGKLTQNSFIPA